MNTDLRYADSTWLAQSADLAWILDAVDRLPQWDDLTASLLDYAYRVRLASLLRTHADADDLSALNRHMLRVAHPIREKQLNGLDRAYAIRWHAFSDILEDRISALGLAVPESVKKRRHVREMLEWILPRQEVSQRQLMEQFDIGEANLSRLLTLMEGWELIVRHRRGKEKFISLGPRAQEMLDGLATAHSRVDELEQEIAKLKKIIEALLRQCPVPGVPRETPPLKVIAYTPPPVAENYSYASRAA